MPPTRRKRRSGKSGSRCKRVIVESSDRSQERHSGGDDGHFILSGICTRGHYRNCDDITVSCGRKHRPQLPVNAQQGWLHLCGSKWRLHQRPPVVHRRTQGRHSERRRSPRGLLRLHDCSRSLIGGKPKLRTGARSRRLLSPHPEEPCKARRLEGSATLSIAAPFETPAFAFGFGALLKVRPKRWRSSGLAKQIRGLRRSTVSPKRAEKPGPFWRNEPET
jgi:hypothetical protein